MNRVKTVCQMCYFYCGLDAYVEDGAIVKIEGMREHPVNHGRLCAKGIAASQLVTDPRRLTHPLRRLGERGGGKWEQISWDEALDTIATRLVAIRDHEGPERVGYYRGQAPGWVTNFNYVIRFMNTLGSPNLAGHAHLCFTPRMIAHATTYGGFPEPDYEHANCIMLFGYNPVYTSPVNYAARIIDAKARGAKLIVVDPRFTNTAAKADLFLQPRPGTDAALILAMIHVLIAEGLYDKEFVERWTVGLDSLANHVRDRTPSWAEAITGVPAATIQKAARLLATTRPAAVVDGNGLDQHTNVVQTVRATTVLRSLIGSIDVPGGSVMVPPLPFVDVQRRGEARADAAKISLMQYPLMWAYNRTLSGPELTDALASGIPYGLQALIIQGGDPTLSLSQSPYVRQALLETGLLVVHDLFPTSAAQIADIVLPAASFLERDLILYYRYRPFADGNLICAQNKAVEPVGESLSDLDLIFALAKRMGYGEWFPWASVDEAFDWELAPNGINVAWLRAHPEGYVRRYPPEELYRKYERQGFNTPSGKLELSSSVLEKAGFAGLPTFIEPGVSPNSRPDLVDRYPLVGATGLKLGIHTHTQYRTLPWIRAIEPEPFVEIHPLTARGVGVSDGERVILQTPEGAIAIKARITEAVAPGVVMATHGWGEPYANGPVSNDVTADQPRDPIAAATGNRSFLCAIRKIVEE